MSEWDLNQDFWTETTFCDLDGMLGNHGLDHSEFKFDEKELQQFLVAPAITGEANQQTLGSSSSRKHPLQNNNTEEGEQIRKHRRPSAKEDPDKEMARYSCPFRRHNLKKFNVRDYRDCAMTLYSISTLK